MKKLSNLLLLSLIPVLISVVIATGIKAANTGSVTATVTAQNISLSVADGAIAYGTIATSGTQDTCTLPDTQTITNDGNVTQDFNLKGQNTGTWTLAGNIGADTYKHEFYTDGTCTSPTALTTNYQSLTTAIGAGSTYPFDLGITLPSSSTVDTEQNADVTVQAAAN